MAKKGSKVNTSGRRSSAAEPVINTVEIKLKSFDDLRKEHTTLEEIRDAVRTLPLDNVLPLLLELLTNFDVQQAHDAVLTEWIKTILLIHTAYFMTLPEVVQQLSTVYQDLDDRLTVYPKLLAMHGRLDLIQSQIDSRNRKDDADEDDMESDNEQAVLYSDTEEELDEDDEGDEDVEEDDEDDLMEMDTNEEVNYFLGKEKKIAHFFFLYSLKKKIKYQTLMTKMIILVIVTWKLRICKIK
jgi:hypothetical protein